jgi:hypothetical protein
MAIMIPPFYSSDIKSSGEKQIFDLFKNAPNTENWIVLHSLCLSKYTRRIYGEIDFVILAPNLGIFCMEVKSGFIKREDGIWILRNRFNEEFQSSKSPFLQAREGMFAIKKALVGKYGADNHFSKILLGYGVMFPHVFFNITSVEYHSWQVYDRETIRQGINNYVKILSSKSAKELSSRNIKFNLPTNKDVKTIANLLRGDFERIISPIIKLNNSEENITRFTKEQFKILDYIQENKRCLFTGGAGTGKTIMAIEIALRTISENKKTLIICFNKLLGSWFYSIFSSIPKVKAGNFHKILMDYTKSKSTVDKEDFFKYQLPLDMIDYSNRSDFEPFDVLIIDEAQDLLCDEYIDVCDSILKGGFRGGNWYVFADAEYQNIFLNYENILETLQARADFVKLNLSINCRNPKPIGEQISLISGLKYSEYLPEEIQCKPVQYYFYTDSEDLNVKEKAIIHDIKKRKIDKGKITFLSPKTYEKSSIYNLNKHNFNIVNINKDSTIPPFNEITFSTIQSFKGLENSIIIVTDIENLNHTDMLSLLYVGISRAKYELHVLMHSSQKNVFNEILERSIINEKFPD